MTIFTTAFIPTITKVLLPKGKSVSASRYNSNALRPRLSRRPRHAIFAQAYTASSATKDDDDETFGGENEPVYGMRLPNLSPEDREYLDSATSNKDFMNRMVEVAHRMDQRRQVDTLTSGRQTPDQYIEGLSRAAKENMPGDGSPSRPTQISPQSPPPSPPPSPSPAPPSSPPPSASQFSKSKAFPAPHAESDSVEDIDAQIAELNRQLVEANESDTVSTAELSSDELENGNMGDLEAQIERLNENIRQVIDDPDIANPSADSDAVDTVDTKNDWDDLTEEKDIQKRMEMIEKKLADAVEKGAGVLSDSAEPVPPMSAEERENEFNRSDALRRKIRSEMGANEDQSSHDIDSDDRASSVERQIAAVQREMEKLQMEEDAEEDIQQDTTDDLSGDWDEEDTFERPENNLKSKASELLAELERKKTVDFGADLNNAKTNEPRYEGLEDVPGQMSAEEKQKAFEMLRKQVTDQKKEPLIDDPYNTVLPDKSERPLESGSEIDEEGEGDVPTGDEDEFDSFGPIAGDKKHLVEELEEETKKYITESRRLLQEHEVKMNVLLSRLMLSFED